MTSENQMLINKESITKLTGKAFCDDETFKLEGDFIPERDQYYFELEQEEKVFFLGFKDMLKCIRLLEKMHEIPEIGNNWWQGMASLYGQDILMVDYSEEKC